MSNSSILGNMVLLKKTIRLSSLHVGVKYLRIIRLSLLLLLSFLAFFNATAAFKYTVYFYSPEANINNFRSLKIEFDTYLLHFGAYQFQPFNDRKTFEKFITGRTDGVFLLSSWHYRTLKIQMPMEPILVGVSKGESTQKRVLSANMAVENIASLKGETVASAGSTEYTQNILRQMLGEERKELVTSLKVLPVPKDIDALIAVGFGMAKSALTMENSLAKLAVLNPKQHQRLRQLATSKEILLPIIAMPKSSDNNVKRLLTIIEEMGTETEGVQKLKMLSLDGWKRLDSSEKRMLEK